MATAHLVQVGDIWLPGIAQYNVDMEDIDSDDTGRSETGIMVRNVLRAKVKKLSFTLKLSDTQLETVAAIFAEPQTVMTIYCPADESATDRYVTSTFYVSKTSINMIKFGEESYWTMSFNAVEV